MSKLKLSILAFALTSLNGCATTLDRTLSPPADTQWVNVEIKNPSPYTLPFPLEVVYISDVCKKRYISGSDGSLKKENSNNGKIIPLERQGNSDIYRAKIAISGGGSCKWRLAKFNLGIEYIDAKHLGKDLVPGTAVGATIAVNDEGSSNGQFEDVYGDLRLTPKYYPFINEWHILKESKELSLWGKENFSSYRVYNAKNIEFKPTIDERKIVKLIEPYEKKDGVYSKLIYPSEIKMQFSAPENYRLNETLRCWLFEVTSP